MQVRVRAGYDALYDQARIIVRLDERNWLKAGIEQSDGQSVEQRPDRRSLRWRDRSLWR
jgi:regulation of enolase protein 1 (concanavalin A-like superfamily)